VHLRVGLLVRGQYASVRSCDRPTLSSLSVVFLRPAVNTRLETISTLHRWLLVRPYLNELQYSASLRHHHVSTEDHMKQPSKRSITAVTRKGPAVRHPPYTTHRVRSTSQQLIFSNFLNATASWDWVLLLLRHQGPEHMPWSICPGCTAAY